MAKIKAADKHEQEWQIDSDARALQDAEEVKDDPKRLKRAMARLKEKAQEASETRRRLEKLVKRGLREAFPKK